MDLSAFRESLSDYTIDRVAEITSVPAEQIRAAALLYATGGTGPNAEQQYPPSLIYQTSAHDDSGQAGYGDPAELTSACINLAIITGNLGLPGGGVASPRGPANYQGATDLGADPSFLPGGSDVGDHESRLRFESAWMPRWGDRATTSNGFIPVRSLPAESGLRLSELPAAIESGRVKAAIVGNTIAGRFEPLDPRLSAALEMLDYLIVTDFYADTPLGRMADVTLPMSMSLEKDGTFTSFDRTVQRIRAAVPPMGEAKSAVEIFSRLSQRMGYGMAFRNSAQVMDEIAKLVPGYGGITYARLERHGVSTPTVSYADAGTPILEVGGPLTPELVPARRLR
jgi:formate dehydrogenase major subunit